MKTYGRLKFLFFVFFGVMVLPLHAQKIGLLLDSYVSDRWYLDKKLFTDKVTALGAEVITEVAYGDPVEQVNLSKKMIQQGVKVLVVVAVDAAKSAEIATIAKAANVPLISYDRLVLSNDVTIYISYNNEKVGELQASYAVNQRPTGNYVLLNGPTADNNAVLFRKGQLKILQPLINSGKIKLLGDFILGDWGEIGALMKVDEFLSTTTEKPDVIIAANDALANGSIQAMPIPMVGKVAVTGQDADLGGLRNIISGKQSMTIYKPLKPLAQLAAETAVSLAKGEAVKGQTKLKSGDISVDAILLDPIVVDKNNYRDTVVKDGHVSASELIIK
jgi:D-xylose transport system substrate-binding protein